MTHFVQTIGATAQGLFVGWADACGYACSMADWQAIHAEWGTSPADAFYVDSKGCSSNAIYERNMALEQVPVYSLWNGRPPDHKMRAYWCASVQCAIPKPVCSAWPSYSPESGRPPSVVHKALGHRAVGHCSSIASVTGLCGAASACCLFRCWRRGLGVAQGMPLCRFLVCLQLATP